MQTIMLWTCRRVGDDDHVVALGALEAELGDRRGAVGQQARAVLVVDPRARDDLGAVLRADVVLVELDDGVDRVGGDQAALGEQRLERAGAQLDLRRRTRMVVVVLVVVVVAHAGSR